MNKATYRVFYYVIWAGLLGGFGLLALAHDSRGWILVGVAAAAALVIMAWSAVTLVRRTLAGQRKVLVPDAPVATPDRPASVDVVLSALDSLNSPDVPFEITSKRTAEGAEVLARWRTEELRWQSLFGSGTQTLAWKMEVRLDAGRAVYRFMEYSASAEKSVGVTTGGNLAARREWDWRRGKTAFQFRASGVVVPGGTAETTRHDGPQTSWEGAIAIQPRDVKIPVFRTLRNHGWRPPRDSVLARMFEG